VVVVVAAEVEPVAVAVTEAQPVALAEVVVVLPQRKLRALPVPEDQLVVRHRRSPRQQTHSFEQFRKSHDGDNPVPAATAASGSSLLQPRQDPIPSAGKPNPTFTPQPSPPD